MREAMIAVVTLLALVGGCRNCGESSPTTTTQAAAEPAATTPDASSTGRRTLGPVELANEIRTHDIRSGRLRKLRAIGRTQKEPAYDERVKRASSVERARHDACTGESAGAISEDLRGIALATAPCAGNYDGGSAPYDLSAIVAPITATNAATELELVEIELGLSHSVK